MVREGLQAFLDEGPVESQAGAKTAAIQQQAVAGVIDIESAGTSLSRALTREFAARQRVSLVGKNVSSAADLALLAQVYRDTRFETFRLVFVDDIGGIVSQLGMTCRLPAAVTTIIGDDDDIYFSGVAEKAKQHGATGYYMLHNHPSGDPKPSVRDVYVTKQYQSQFESRGLVFHQHVVIDTNKFSVIKKDGNWEMHEREFGQPKPYECGEWEGVRLSSPAKLMEVAKRLEVDRDAVTLIVTNRSYDVHGITCVPAASISMDVEQNQRLLAKAALAQMGCNVFAVGRNKDVLMRLRVTDAALIQRNGEVISLGDEGVISIDKEGPFPQNRETRLSPDTDQAFRYLADTSIEAMKTRNMRVMAERSYKEAHDFAAGCGYDVVEPNIVNGIYCGAFLQVGPAHAVQAIGRGKVIIHEMSRMNNVKPEQGTVVSVSYRGGEASFRRNNGNQMSLDI